MKKTVIVTLIHANWCGHCKELMPVWEKLKKELNESNVILQEIEESEIKAVKKNKDIMEKNITADEKGNEVEAYPSIFIEYGKEATEVDLGNKILSYISSGDKVKEPYAGGRTVEDMKKKIIGINGEKPQSGGKQVDYKLKYKKYKLKYAQLLKRYKSIVNK